jgi:hypothetical protein
MKYKRQLMTGIFALALMAGGSSVFAAENFIPNSKLDQYQNQVQMKSYAKNTTDDNQKTAIKKHKKSQRTYKQKS